MKRTLSYIIASALLTIIACTDNNDTFDFKVEIPDFNFPKTIVFEDNLSAYNIFEGSPAELIPSNDFQLLELSSIAERAARTESA